MILARSSPLRGKPPLGSILDVTHPLGRGCVVCLLFNEFGGRKVFDISPTAHHGTLTGTTGAPVWQSTAAAGLSNGPGVGSFQGRTPDLALSFASANSQYVDVPYSATGSPFTGAFTLSWWQYLISGPSFHGGPSKCVSGSPRPFDVYTTSAGNLAFFAASTNLQTSGSGSNLTTNKWNHIACVYDGSSLLIYTGGKLNCSGAASTPYTDGGESIRLGRRDDGATTLNGFADRFRAYNRGLGASEIEQLALEPDAAIIRPNPLRFYSIPSASGLLLRRRRAAMMAA